MPLGQSDDPLELSVVSEPKIPEVLATEDAAKTAKEEEIDWDKRAKAEDVKRLEHENAQRGQDREERKNYANRIFCLICIRIGLVMLLLLLQGFPVTTFRLADSVVITVVGKTTGTVLGIFLIVASYLFPKR